MPELPEVEVLVRRLAPILTGRRMGGVTVYRDRIIRPLTSGEFQAALKGRHIVGLRRRAKYLVFELRLAQRKQTSILLGHLGMTGRFHVLPRNASLHMSRPSDGGRARPQLPISPSGAAPGPDKVERCDAEPYHLPLSHPSRRSPWPTSGSNGNRPLPKHTAVVFHFADFDLAFEDSRYFGRFALGNKPLQDIGPEPLDAATRPDALHAGLRRSKQAIKMRLLDQSWIAGVGNIYAAEALFEAGIDPRRPACSLDATELHILLRSLRATLQMAIRRGSTLTVGPDDYFRQPGLFYRDKRTDEPNPALKLHVYDREAQPCLRCRRPIQRIIQAGRSTYFCPRCQS